MQGLATVCGVQQAVVEQRGARKTHQVGCCFAPADACVALVAIDCFFLGKTHTEWRLAIRARAASAYYEDRLQLH